MEQNAEIFAEVSGFAVGLIERSHGEDREHVVVVANALVSAAEMIYRHIGGVQHAAVQFYAVADRCVDEWVKKRE